MSEGSGTEGSGTEGSGTEGSGTQSAGTQSAGTESTGRQGLEQVQERIDEAKEAAGAAEQDLLPHGPSSADPRSPEDGAFEPSGDDSNAGENPSEGPDADTPGSANP